MAKLITQTRQWLIVLLYSTATFTLMAEVTRAAENKSGPMHGQIVFMDIGGEGGFKGTVQVQEFVSMSVNLGTDNSGNKKISAFPLKRDTTLDGLTIVKNGVGQGQSRTLPLWNVKSMRFGSGYGHREFKIVTQNGRSVIVRLPHFWEIGTLTFMYEDPDFGGVAVRTIWVSDLVPNFDD